MSNRARNLNEVLPQSGPENLAYPEYKRDDVRIGIAHIGVGGFHRAHQCRYLDDYMSTSGDLAWGICGIGLMPGDKGLIETLKRQDGLYTLTEKDDEDTQSRVIGALSRLIFAPDHPEEVVAVLADPKVSIISMTITEGGYRYDFEKDRFFSEHPDIQYDLANPDSPRTIFGYLWQACRFRAKLGQEGRVTLLSCDNVPHNGDVLRKAVLAFIDLAEPALRPWFEQAVTYPNSMVDRITPAPSQSDCQYVLDRFQLQDPCAVGCEPFIQWVVEDKFAANRPDLARVGVRFTDDVDPYEKTKLRLLNGSHLMMGFVGYLAGYKRVDLAISDAAIGRLVRNYMSIDAAPTLPALPDIPLEDYQSTLIKRFANSRVADQQVRICTDGYAKLKNYVMPLVWDMLNRGMKTHRLSFMFGCFLAYLEGRADDGSTLEIIEFNLPEHAMRMAPNDRISLFTTEAFFAASPTGKSRHFLDEVHAWQQLISNQGAYRTLVESLNTID